MGSWNETCMVTHLPIFAGEPCLGVVLMEASYWSAGCYATSEYTPIFSVRGEYDDYGGLADIKEESQIMSVLRTLNPHQLDDTGVLVPAADLETFHDFVEACQNGLFVKQTRGVTSSGKKQLRLKVIYIKECVLQLAKQNLEDRYKEDPDLKEYVETSYASAEKATLAYTEAMANGETGGPLFDKDWAVYEAINKLFALFPTSYPMVTAKSFVRDIWEKEWKRFLPMYHELMQLTMLLGDLRKNWSPTSGTGSQEDVTPIHRKYLKMWDQELTTLEHRLDE